MLVHRALLLACLFTFAFGDVYLHAPRGSNDRNREDDVNRDNANRLFDSQNNAKGGYCWGPPMTYYEGSLLQVEWTNQHGCGVGQANDDCDVIIQYMCSPDIRDGLTTDTITADTVNTMDTDTVTGQVTYKYGMHEPASYYAKCSTRSRNHGLFTADQNMGSTTSARQTRQQNNENDQHGFECPEERDYYPYWQPSPWRDIAIVTSNVARCPFFKAQSQNVLGRYECSNPMYNNMADCSNASQWVYVQPWGVDAPDCVPGPISRDNHLGNTPTGITPSYSWTIPSLSSIGSSYLNSDGSATCVLRLRYNISTADYDGWGSANGNPTAKFVDSNSNAPHSPVYQDPYLNYSTAPWFLRLALNTDQYGRTFQDRSYTFFIRPRPSSVASTARLFNVNVRGKRGNIVEAYPAVEYDFTPNDLVVNLGDYVHFQWTGCDTNPDYSGEGTDGTDRSNIVQLSNRGQNYMMAASDQTLFSTPGKAWEMAYLNQYGGTMCTTSTQSGCCKTYEMLQTTNNANQDPQNCAKLNDPGVQYFDGGISRLNTAGTYNYMSTRNNNFSNRSQKATITVQSIVATWGVVLVSAGGFTFVAASMVAATSYYASTHPASAVANLVSAGGCKL